MKKIIIAFFTLLGVFFAAENVVGQPSLYADRLTSVVNSYYEAGQFNGVVLVSRDQEVIFEQARGYSDRSTCELHTREGRFQIGSITKQFTAAIVLDLVEEGRLDLNRSIVEYLPDFQLAQENQLTLHQLLSHTAGIGDVSTAEDFEAFMTIPMPTSERLERFCSSPLGFPPGSSWSYSNCGYEIAGAVVEAVTGTPYNQYFNNFLQQAGLEETSFTDDTAKESGLVEGYRFSDGSWQLIPEHIWDNAVASGSITSTARDLLKWHQVLFDHTVISASSQEVMIQPVQNSYAYGWYTGWGSLEQIDELLSSVRQEAPVPQSMDLNVVAHSGDLEGFHSLMIQILNTPYVIVILDNHDVTGIYDHRRISHIGADIVRVLFEGEVRGPQSVYGPATVPVGLAQQPQSCEDDSF